MITSSPKVYFPNQRTAIPFGLGKIVRQGVGTDVSNKHDACLVDYRLGAHDGIELLRSAIERGCQSPIILLTGQGEHEIDLAAMESGPLIT